MSKWSDLPRESETLDPHKADAIEVASNLLMRRNFSVQ